MKISSKLENTYIKGILIKKGINEIPEDVYKTLSENKIFQNYIRYGHVTVIDKGANNDTPRNGGTDFNTLTYAELKEYVKKHNIEVKSFKKDDILEALNSLEGSK